MDKYIITPDVTIVADGEDLLDEEEYFTVDMIAMAAINHPKLNPGGTYTPEDYKLTLQKIDNIFMAGIRQECDILVLGALGCGAFKNPPQEVIKMFNICLKKWYGYFHTVIFSVLSTHRRDYNFAFFDKYIVRQFTD